VDECKPLARGRVRAMEADTEFAELFDRYERDIAGLSRENSRLREENVDALMAGAYTRPLFGSTQAHFAMKRCVCVGGVNDKKWLRLS